MSAPSDTAPGSHTPPAIAAVIVAAGSGSRMQEAVPKQFLALCGKPVLCHSVDAFASHATVVEIIIVGRDGEPQRRVIEEQPHRGRGQPRGGAKRPCTDP